MTSPNLGEAAGRVTVHYESTGAQRVTDELRNLKKAGGELTSLSGVTSNVAGSMSRSLGALGGAFTSLLRTGTVSTRGLIGALGNLAQVGSNLVGNLTKGLLGGIPKLTGAAGIAGKGAGLALSGALTAAVIPGVTAAATAIAGIGIALGAGFKRTVALDEAKGKLRALGNTGEEVREIMDSVNEAVLGTPFALQAGADAAVGALAAGIEAGQDLTDWIKTIANAATVAGRPLEDMAIIFNRIQGTGKLTGRFVQQLEYAGVYVVPMLAKAMGKSQEEVRKEISKSAISAEQFREVIAENMGKAADEAAKTFKGRIMNLTAAVGRLGEQFWRPFFEPPEGAEEGAEGPIKRLLANTTSWINQLTDNVKRFMTENQGTIRDWASRIGGAFSTAKDVVSGVYNHFQQTFGNIIKIVGTLYKSLWDAGKQIGNAFQPMLEQWGPALQTAKDAVASAYSSIMEWFGKLADWVSEHQEQITSFFVTVGQVVLKFAEIVISTFGRVIQFIGTLGDAFGTFIGVMIKGFGFLTRAVGGVAGVVAKFTGKGHGVREMADQVADSMFQWGETSKNVGNVIQGIGAGIADFGGDIGKAGAWLGKWNSEQKEQTKQQDKGKKSTDAAEKSTKQKAKTDKEAAEETKGLFEALKEAGVTFEEISDALQGTDEQFEKFLNTLAKKGIPADFLKYLQKLRQEVQSVNPGVKSLQQAIRNLGDTTLSAADRGGQLIKALQQLGYLPGEAEDAMSSYAQTIDDLSRDTKWIDWAEKTGNALVDQSGALILTEENARKLHDRFKQLQGRTFELVAAGYDSNQVWEQSAEAMRLWGRQVGLSEDVLEHLIVTYLTPKQTFEVLYNAQGGDDIRNELISIFTLYDGMKRQGKTQFEFDYPVPKGTDPEQLRAELEALGVAVTDFNELSRLMKIEIPEPAKFEEAKRALEIRLASPVPITIEPPPGPVDVPVEGTLVADDVKVEGQVEIPATIERGAPALPVAPTYTGLPRGPNVGLPPTNAVTQELLTGISEFADQVPDALRPAIDKAREQGRAFAEAFAVGISSGLLSVREAALAIAEMAAGALPGSPAKYGPLSGPGAPYKRGAGYTSAFAQGIQALITDVKASAVNVAYGAGKPMTDSFDQFLKDMREFVGFGRNVFELMSGVVDLGLKVADFANKMSGGRLFPQQYQRATGGTLEDQMARQQARALWARGAPGFVGAQGQVAAAPAAAGAGGMNVLPVNAVPLVQNPDGTWTSPNPAWAALIKRESGGRADIIQGIIDANSGGNEAEGLFQIAKSTWRAYRGEEFAATPRLATPQQQAAIAARIFKAEGMGPWGNRESAEVARRAFDDAAQAVQANAAAAQSSTQALSNLGRQSSATTRALGDVQSFGKTMVDVTRPMTGILQEANLQPATLGMGRAIAQIFGPQGISTIGGYRANDPYPFHPSGRAIDVMIPQWGTEAGRALGDSIAKWAIQNAETIGLESFIWRQQYYGAENNWKASFMADRGDATQNHMDHLHLQTRVGAIGLDTANAMGLTAAGLPITLPSNAMGPTGLQIGALPGRDSFNLGSIAGAMSLGIPAVIQEMAKEDPQLTEIISAVQGQKTLTEAEMIPALQHLDGLIADANTGNTPQAEAQAQALGGIRESLLARGGMEAAAGGTVLDQVGNLTSGMATIVGDFIDIFEITLKAIADTKDMTGMLARGIANTEDIMRMVDVFQTYLELGAKVAQTVSNISGYAAGIAGAAESAAGMGGGAAAGLQAVSMVADIIAVAMTLVNTGIEVAQEAYRLITKYMGRMLTTWLGFPGATDIRWLLDTMTGQLLAYTSENPEFKTTMNTLGRSLGGRFPERRPPQNQFNIYQGPGQDPRDTMNDAMFAIRSSGVGAFGYAGT